MEAFEEVVPLVARAVELLGVGIIAVGLPYAFIVFALNFRRAEAYAKLRQQVGKAILLGLEVLVAADIVMTVTTEPTVENVLVLGLVVLIRTFLSFSLEVELEGRWPWQQPADSVPGDPGRTSLDEDSSERDRGIMAD